MTGPAKTPANEKPTSDTVDLVKHPKQFLVNEVRIGAHKFVGDEPTAVPAGEADELIARHDPDGLPFVARAK